MGTVKAVIKFTRTSGCLKETKEVSFEIDKFYTRTGTLPDYTISFKPVRHVDIKKELSLLKSLAEETDALVELVIWEDEDDEVYDVWLNISKAGLEEDSARLKVDAEYEREDIAFKIVVEIIIPDVKEEEGK